MGTLSATDCSVLPQYIGSLVSPRHPFEQPSSDVILVVVFPSSLGPRSSLHGLIPPFNPSSFTNWTPKETRSAPIRVTLVNSVPTLPSSALLCSALLDWTPS